MIKRFPVLGVLLWMLFSSLFYWIALPQLDTRREFPDGRSQRVHLPLKLHNESVVLRIHITQTFDFPRVFRFFGDDCIDEIEVNGQKLKADGEWCNWVYGFEVDFSSYWRAAGNEIVMKAEDRDGLGGVNFQISRTSSFFLLQQVNLIVCITLLVFFLARGINTDVYECVILALILPRFH